VYAIIGVHCWFFVTTQASGKLRNKSLDK